MADGWGGVDTVLHVLEIVSIVGGGGAVLFRGGRIAQKIEGWMASSAEQISKLETGVNAIQRLMTDVALQNQRLDTHDKRLDNLDRYVDDLRRGDGLILAAKKN